MDEEIYALAARQFNRFSRRQLVGLGMSNKGIRHRLEAGRIVRVEAGVSTRFPRCLTTVEGCGWAPP